MELLLKNLWMKKELNFFVENFSNFQYFLKVEKLNLNFAVYHIKTFYIFAPLNSEKFNFKRKRAKFMIIVPVKEGESIDRSLKKLKRKFEKTGVVKELRNRQKFTKPSIVRREEIRHAIYIQQLQQQQETE